MNGYRIKEIFWGIALVIAILILMSGCASSPQGSAKPYCYTAQEIRTKNGSTVSSETLLQCTDDPIEKVTIKRAGIAKNCGEYTYYVTLNGKSVQQRGLACEKFNGSWEIVPNYAAR